MNFTKGYIRYLAGGRERTGEFELAGQTEMSELVIEAAMDGENGGRRLRVRLSPGEAIEILEFSLRAAVDIERSDALFLNGFQSWTESREFRPDERLYPLFAGLRAIKLQWLGDAEIFPHDGKRGRLHGYTCTYIKKPSGRVVFAGSLSEDSGYTLFDFRPPKGTLWVRKDLLGLVVREPAVVLDLWLGEGDETSVFETYWEKFGPTQPGPPLTGWTSWYRHYTDISEKAILADLESFTRLGLPIDVFQIDDGFQRAVGDWLDIKETFPRGMKPVADRIRDAGLKPGLWLAPFIAEKKSGLLREHPDWTLKGPRSKPQPAGWNPKWSGTYYALDVLRPEVREYLKSVFRTVLEEWGFQFLKLDFLYAAALAPGRGRSRGAIMAEAMEFLRECAGDAPILGCGVPLGSAFGRVAYCRIGSDVALKWEDRPLRWARYRERISTVNSLVSTIGRRHMDQGAFRNDPDVLILRDRGHRLSEPEKHSLFLLNNLFGGLVFTSDDPGEFDPAGLARLRSMFPLKNKRIERVTRDDDRYDVRFRIGDLEYLVYANLSGRPWTVRLATGSHYFENDGPTGRFVAGGAEISLAPRQSRCFLIVPPTGPAVAGSTGYLFPGAELTLEILESGKLRLKRDPRSAPGTAYIRVPRAGEYEVNGEKFEAVARDDGLYLLEIPPEGIDA